MVSLAGEQAGNIAGKAVESVFDGERPDVVGLVTDAVRNHGYCGL
ncbi:hypothetical protein [Hahella ganghwensis]|nr:hypothetical protein [Hahella ganghwensis]